MQIKSIKGVGISSGSNKYEHDDAMEEKTMNVFCDFFSSFLFYASSLSFSSSSYVSCFSSFYLYIFFIIYEKAVFMIVWAMGINFYYLYLNQDEN